MILLALLIQIDTALTFGEAKRLPPAVAGERLLKGENFRPIESFARFGATFEDRPGLVESRLFEQPVATPLGCTRQQWTVKFQAQQSEEPDSALPYDRYRATEIALPKPSGCAVADYVHFNPGISEAQGFAVLRQLEKLRSGRKNFTISCTEDDTASSFCMNKAAILSAIARLTPWNIASDPNGFRVWLGTPGRTVTEVRFHSQRPSHVWVDRRFPAPF